MQLSCWFVSSALDALLFFLSSFSPHHLCLLFSSPSSPTCILSALFLPLPELPCVRSSQYLDFMCSSSCQVPGAKANVWWNCWPGLVLVSAARWAKSCWESGWGLAAAPGTALPTPALRPLLTAHASRTGHVPHPPAWDRGAANFPTPVWHFRGRLWLIDKKLFCPGIFASVFPIFYAW